MAVLDLTRPLGDPQRKPDEPVRGEIVSWLTDEPFKRDKVRIITAQDVEPVLRANRMRRLHGGDGFIRCREGLGRLVATIPDIDYLNNPALAEAEASQNDEAFIREVRRHPEWCTVEPRSI